MGVCDCKCVIVQKKTARCSLNNEERAMVELVYKSMRSPPRVFENISKPLKCNSIFGVTYIGECRGDGSENFKHFLFS